MTEKVVLSRLRNEEHVSGWLHTELKKWYDEVVKCAQWVEESKEDVKKARNMLAGFEYQLEEARTVLSFLKKLEARD